LYTKLPGTSDLIYIPKSNRPPYTNGPPTTWTLQIKYSAANCPAHVLLAVRLLPEKNNHSNTSARRSRSNHNKLDTSAHQPDDLAQTAIGRALAQVSTPSSPPSPLRIHRQSSGPLITIPSSAVSPRW
jgi:hypothetical protein